MPRLLNLVVLSWVLLGGIAAARYNSVVLAQFSEPEDPLVGSKAILSGSSELPLNQRAEYVLHLEAVEAPQRDYRPGYVSNGVVAFLVPQTSLSRGGGMYVYFDSLKAEVFDPKEESWVPLDEEKNADAEYMKTVPLRALPFGVGVLAGFLIDRKKPPADQFLMSEEEYRNYYKEVKQLWSAKYPKLRVTLPVELRGPLTDREKFGLQLYYEEGSATYRGSQNIYDSNRETKTRKFPRQVIVDDLLAALQGK